MKKIFAFVAAALMMVACGTQKNYVVEGTIEGLSGQVIVMDIEGRTILGLATVAEDGSFKMDIESGEVAPQVGFFTIENTPVCPIFFDGQKVVVEGNAYGGLIVSGTPANDAFAAYNVAMEEFYNNLPEDFDAENPTEEATEGMKKLLAEQFEANKDNLFGGFMVLSGMVPAQSPEELIGYMDQLGKEAQALSQLQDMRSYMEQMISAEETPAEE